MTRSKNIVKIHTTVNSRFPDNLQIDVLKNSVIFT